MTRKLLYCSVLGSSRKVRDALGDPSHIVQIRVAGMFPSRIAFARAARDAGLLWAASDNAVSNYVRTYGQSTDHPGMVADHAHWQPETLYVARLNDHTEDYRPLADVLATPGGQDA